MPTRIAISNTFNVSTIEDGVSAPYVVLSRSVILYNANPNGESTSSQSFAITYSLRVANDLIPSSSITNVNITSLTGVIVSNKTNSGCTLICANGATTNGVITITMYGTYEGVAYNASANISIAPNRKGQEGEQGQTGQRGKIGRFFYYAGVFNQADDDRMFPINDAQAPYFEHTDESQIKRYHVFDPEQNPEGEELSMAEMWAATGGWNVAPWRIMYDDFKYLITEAIFGNFAHLGSAIISGDWKLSQYGKIYDTNGEEHIIDSTNTWNSGTHTYTKNDAYTLFDSDYPNSSKPSANNFVPNYAEDWLSGATYQQEAYVAGSLYAQSIQLKFFDVEADEDGLFYVGLQGEQGIWNFRITEDVKIVLPTNQYSNYGQRVTIYNPILGLGGTGDETIIVASQVVSDGEGGWIYAGNAAGGLTLNFDDIRGVALPYGSSGGELTPVAINSYTPVRRIVFNNGIVELMCVPTSIQGQTCEWCVINLGTNVLRLYPTAQG